MGSGSGGSYSGTSGGSQPYAPSYHVEPKMRQYDIKNGTYHDGRYEKNPTAKNLVDEISGNYIGSKSTSFQMPYVIDLDGNIIIGRRNGNGRGENAIPTPHPTLIGGKDPVVKMAGILEVRGGKIYKYDNQSGHYKPNIKSMDAAHEAFSKLNPKLFHKNFKKR